MVIFIIFSGVWRILGFAKGKARIGAERRLDIANAVLQHKSVVFACFKME